MAYVGKTGYAKNYKGKNGYTSTYTKVKTNEGYKWKKSTSTPRSKKK